MNGRGTQSNTGFGDTFAILATALVLILTLALFGSKTWTKEPAMKESGGFSILVNGLPKAVDSLDLFVATPKSLESTSRFASDKVYRLNKITTSGSMGTNETETVFYYCFESIPGFDLLCLTEDELRMEKEFFTNFRILDPGTEEQVKAREAFSAGW